MNRLPVLNAVTWNFLIIAELSKNAIGHIVSFFANAVTGKLW